MYTCTEMGHETIASAHFVKVDGVVLESLSHLLLGRQGRQLGHVLPVGLAAKGVTRATVRLAINHTIQDTHRTR